MKKLFKKQVLYILELFTLKNPSLIAYTTH